VYSANAVIHKEVNTMHKIVINNCFGGFDLSEKAVMRYAEIKGIKLYPEKERGLMFYYRVPKNQRTPELKDWSSQTMEARQAYNEAWDKETLTPSDIPRDDPVLIQVVEELGEEANGMCAHLKVIEIPDTIQWHIEEYDGNEHVAQDHMTWS
jgi:hypothetical protein